MTDVKFARLCQLYAKMKAHPELWPSDHELIQECLGHVFHLSKERIAEMVRLATQPRPETE